MRGIFPPAVRALRLARAGLLVLALTGWASSATAQDRIAPAAPPPDWQSGTLQGIGFALPPGWSEMERASDIVTLFGGDPDTRTGPAFGITLTPKPMQLFRGSDLADLGRVVFDSGLEFTRHAARETPEPGMTIEGEFLISAAPMPDGNHIVILMSGFNTPFDAHRALFDTALAALRLPPPGQTPVRAVLGGAFGVVLPPGWEISDLGDTATLKRQGMQGEISLMRHDVASAGQHRSGWYVPPEVTGKPVLFLDESAILYDWSEASRHYDDGRDSLARNRLFIFEACLDGGDTASVSITGMPDFHDDPSVLRLIDDMTYHAGAAPCRPIDLPGNAPMGTPRKERAVESDYTIWVEPATPGDGWTSYSFGPLDFALYAGWSALPGDGDWSHWISRQGEYELAMRLQPEPVGPAARRGEVRLSDGTRFYRRPVPDGTVLASVAPVGPEGYLLIEAKGGMIDGPGFETILGTMTLRPADAPASASAEPASLLDGMVRITPPEGFVLLSEKDSVTLTAEDGRGYLTLARGGAVMPPHGLLARMPEGRLGSYGGGAFGTDWTEYGWPGTVPEFMDGAEMVTGWHFLRIARMCLPGGVPVALGWGGITRFTGGDSLGRAMAAFDVDWPDGMIPCDPADLVAAVPEPKVTSVDIPLTVRPAPAAEATLAPAPRQAAPAAMVEAVTAPPPDRPSPPPPPPPPPSAAADPDLFEDRGGGYALYRNARYGTEIVYPSGYFHAEPAPGNGDGRRFASADGAARFLVFAQYNVFGHDLRTLMAEDQTLPAYRNASYKRAGSTWYVISGRSGAEIFYRKVLLSADDLLQVFEITYPARLKTEFDAVVSYMAQSFGPVD
ncbi:hypothetical protein [Rhodovulum euryhalinum]|uniref:Uncharacterized protein n=1 Tax=Rhodovulum euryhalinum TaxID=35805 RepID=A0A4R2K5L4_9RHOB|nr:hypothetical protein [Rhodovulum euryhalinum]TCO68531.1 hypothetical protein EV655_1265 [Rhodovulum euryhalinum]